MKETYGVAMKGQQLVVLVGCCSMLRRQLICTGKAVRVVRRRVENRLAFPVFWCRPTRLLGHTCVSTQKEAIMRSAHVTIPVRCNQVPPERNVNVEFALLGPLFLFTLANRYFLCRRKWVGMLG